jgi:tetratricopeptide (TPR) repeat protein
MEAHISIRRSAFAVAFALLSASAFAAGDGGGSDGGSGGNGGGSGDSGGGTTCTGGKKYNPATGKCTGYVDSIYEKGRELAKSGRFGEAITILSLAADQGDARVLNYLGYSHRMQGRVTVGLGYYQEALRIAPEYTLVREYMGEAYLQLGDLTAAQNQLSELERLCGKGCNEYNMLQKRIADYKAKI